MKKHFFKDYFRILCGILFFSFPLLVHAQSVKEIFKMLSYTLSDYVIPFFMSLAVAVFLWGVVRFIAASGNPEQRQSAKHLIIWGLVGVFVLVAFWGLIKLLLNTFFGAGGSPGPPGSWPPTINW